MQFDKDKCVKLLKERKSLQKEGKSLREYDRTKYHELIDYLTWIHDEIFWESRQKYIQILDLFVSKKITLDQFFDQFFSLRGSNLTSAKMWEEKLEKEAFVVSPKSYGFTKIISYLHSIADLCDPDVTFEMNLKDPELITYGISEEFLRLRIENYVLPKLEKYCKKS